MDFNSALVAGGGSGIGKAVSRYFIERQKAVTAKRTEPILQTTAKGLGQQDTTSWIRALSQTSHHSPSASPLGIRGLTILSTMRVYSAGYKSRKQSREDLLSKAHQKFDINIRGPVHPACWEYVPLSVMNPAYNGTKAWLHFQSMNLRGQLKDTPRYERSTSHHRPSRQICTRREREGPDDNKKAQNRNPLPIAESMDGVSRKLGVGEGTIGAGMSADFVKKQFDTLRDMYRV
ncbi:hypothetical protein DL765_003710 [Monosporascus sp. GIB2]|nr:hypothetical protein DL765_003710 [Monosporascus sp. GIB2]